MVDIVIVNWNGGDYLSKCVDSIFLKSNEEVLGTVFIIDNNSSDESLRDVSNYEKVIVIKNRENNGFSKACNQGFKLCTSPYVLLLNPDTQLFDTTLKQCASFMKEHLEIDILGCQLLNDDGNISYSCARFPTPRRYFFDITGLSKFAPKIFTPALLMTDWDHKDSRKVNQVMGAFMFMRLPIFKQYGYFDERFFVYYEELDFSKRIYDAGGITYFNSTIKAIHSGGGTTNSVKSFRLFLNVRSRLQYAKKHFSFFGYVFVLICTYTIEPFTRSTLLLLRGRFKEIRETLKAYKLLLIGNERG